MDIFSFYSQKSSYSEMAEKTNAKNMLKCKAGQMSRWSGDVETTVNTDNAAERCIGKV